jgi:hypothetical protein
VELHVKRKRVLRRVHEGFGLPRIERSPVEAERGGEPADLPDGRLLNRKGLSGRLIGEKIQDRNFGYLPERDRPDG